MKLTAFINTKYPPESSPMAWRLHCYLKQLKEQNIDVEAIYLSKKSSESGVFENIPYRHVEISPKRKLRLNIKHFKELYNVYLEEAKKTNVIYTTEEYNLDLFIISKAVRKVSGKLVIEFCENPYTIKTNRLDFKLIRYLSRIIFLNYTIKRVDGIIAISSKLMELAKRYKKNSAQLIYMPILTGEKYIKRDIKNNRIPYILHAGTISEVKDGVKAMLKAFLLANNKLEGKLKFIFTHNKSFPSLLKWVNNFIEKHDLNESIEFWGVVPNDKLNELYDNCALAIINKPINSQNEYNFPTKLTQYLQREIPLIISRTGELKNYFTDNINALLVEPNNAEQISEKIITLIKNPSFAYEIGCNGRKLALKKFYYKNYSKDMKDFFEQIIKVRNL